MTDDPHPDDERGDRIAIQMTRTGSAADVATFLDRINAAFDDEEYTLAVEFETTESFGGGEFPVGDLAALGGETPSRTADAQTPTFEVERDEAGETDASADAGAATDPAPDETETETEADPDDEDGEDESQGVVCPGCGETFDSEPGLHAHSRWCDEPADEGEDADADAGGFEKFDDEGEGEDEGAGAGDPDDAPPAFTLNPGTRKYRVASTLSALLGEFETVTSRDVYDALDGTEWAEEDHALVSGAFFSLHKDDAVTREGHDPGTNAYTYQLTPAGRARIERVEAEAETTFRDLRQSWIDADAADADETDDEADDDEADDDEADDLPTMNPGTWRFRVASTLYHADAPQTPAEVEATLSGTEWDHDRASMSQWLGDLYRDDIATREERVTDARRTTYAYALTEAGADLVEATAREAVESGDRVFSDVVDAATAAVDPSPDADADADDEGEADEGPTGLDALFSADDPADADTAADGDAEKGGLVSQFEGTDYESSLDRAIDATQD